MIGDQDDGSGAGDLSEITNVQLAGEAKQRFHCEVRYPLADRQSHAEQCTQDRNDGLCFAVAPRYQLETIPVWRALEQQPECALCALESQSEERNVEFFLGNSIMVPEMRVQLNRHGFCRRHFHKLLGGAGRLGLSLAVSTHLEDVAERIAHAARGASGRRKPAAATLALAEMIDEQASDCLMCERIRKNVSNYLYTVVKLFSSDEGFREVLDESSGLCFYHLPGALRMAAEVLKPDELVAWNVFIVGHTHRELEKLRNELEQFSWQFDATSDKQTPESAQDSVPRAIRKIAGPE